MGLRDWGRALTNIPSIGIRGVAGPGEAVSLDGDGFPHCLLTHAEDSLSHDRRMLLRLATSRAFPGMRSDLRSETDCHPTRPKRWTCGKPRSATSSSILSAAHPVSLGARRGTRTDMTHVAPALTELLDDETMAVLHRRAVRLRQIARRLRIQATSSRRRNALALVRHASELDLQADRLELTVLGPMDDSVRTA